jgi:hypothetical protein
VRLVGYSNLQGRPALQIVLKGDFAYVGHHPGSSINPLSGKMEPNGTSILAVSNPSLEPFSTSFPACLPFQPGASGAGNDRSNSG